ncbi:chromosome partitioning protein [Bathymodiolus platifrons methanotrophic gill symbiont]|uniref:AAA family ATPase n=1 Tax=Bathymodiolus platifrons methanotrophic gill symbiont TaxID=113268 RepID=UPI001B6CF31A|nr:AAA family ATPase [Bathymodiolus platifrons methanotrophic gill symbiont]GFO77815.1 chromosome partitioning protein [Bathymodiolus platifrons methanotrophic gill symbiont]
MIILIGSQKGGCGKSTIATNMAATLAVDGKDVMLVDADKQASSSNWFLDRSENSDLPQVNSVQKYDDVRASILDLSKRYEYIVIDAAGRDSAELRTSMIVADILVMAIRPSQFDLDTVPKMQEIYTDAKMLNEKLKFKAVITMGPTNPIINEAEETQGFLENYPDIELLDTIIRERKVYRDAIKGIGMGVVEMNNPKAKKEIQDFMSEVLK